MQTYEETDYKIFQLFKENWGLVTAGTPSHFNTCTVSWGSLGTLWTRPGNNGQVVTVYIHPGRYTLDFLKENPLFTLSFFPPEQKKALLYLGCHSGREEDKVAKMGLTPVSVGDPTTGASTGFAEATRTFLCRKIYAHPFDRDSVDPEMQVYYRDHPSIYPPDENGDWQPHWIIIGEILEVM